MSDINEDLSEIFDALHDCGPNEDVADEEFVRVSDYIADLEAQLKKAKAKGIREAVDHTRAAFTAGGRTWLCPVKDLLAYADQLEGKDNG